MPSRLGDYALIGDCQTAALVARNPPPRKPLARFDPSGRPEARLWATVLRRRGGGTGRPRHPSQRGPDRMQAPNRFPTPCPRQDEG